MMSFILVATALVRDVRAQSQNCQKNYIDQCREKMTRTIGRADAEAGSIRPAGDGPRDMAMAQQAAHERIARGWDDVTAQCLEIQENCGKQCHPANECKSEIDKVVRFANGKANDDKQAAASSMQSASAGDDQDSAMERETASVQRANQSNLDAIRGFQKYGPCTQSGSGQITKCQDASGNEVLIPSGPGDAFKAFRGSL